MDWDFDLKVLVGRGKDWRCLRIRGTADVFAPENHPVVCYGFELQSVRDARPLPKGITHIFQVLPRWLQSIGLKRWCAHPGIYGQLCSRIASEYEEHLERIGEREPASQWPGLHDTYAEWRGER